MIENVAVFVGLCVMIAGGMAVVLWALWKTTDSLVMMFRWGRCFHRWICWHYARYGITPWNKNAAARREAVDKKDKRSRAPLSRMGE